MNNENKLIAVAAVIVGLVLAGATYLGVHKSASAPNQVQEVGSVVNQNIPWFTNGYKVGTLDALYNAASLTVAVGSDQAVWKNTTGQTVVIDTTHAVTNATTSSALSAGNYAISVGATSTATILEKYSNTYISAAANTPLAIDKFSLATSSPTGFAAGSLTTRLLADNFWFHASSGPSQIRVPNGWYFFAKIDSQCTADGACGRTSTSTTRGFTTLTVPFWYHYSSPN